ncbi:MAG: hypothetical protein L6R39_004196 [Caloplaca ligustica]|nr:MAG: hypothetical protein L6R39_004196 [Caloplaca ligustica]
MASLPAMPDKEAKTIAVLSSMQLNISARTTVAVTLAGCTLRTKKMRVKLMTDTLVRFSISRLFWITRARERESLHGADEKLNAHGDPVVQAHLQIGDPDDRDAEDNDIGDEVGDAGSQPSCALFGAMTEIRGPCGPQGLAFGQVVGDGTDQKPAHGGESNYLDYPRVLPPGAGHEDASVQDDEGELEETERSGPAEFFNEQCLPREPSDGEAHDL